MTEDEDNQTMINVSSSNTLNDCNVNVNEIVEDSEKGDFQIDSDDEDHSQTSVICSHTKQYILRQPFPLPLPSITPLVNLNSQYHIKVLAGDLDWGSACAYNCMIIECARVVFG